MGIPRRSRYPLLAAALWVAACQPTTAPDLGVQFDGDATLAAYEAMDSLMASPDIDAFLALKGRTPFGAPAAGAIGALADAARADEGRAFALTLARRLADAGLTAGPAAAPIISDFHRGTTFIYDPETNRYVADPEREGAPETGVRFVLYEVDLLGTPTSDEEIGYADLVDGGDSSAEDVVLDLTAVAHETTVLEYRITLDTEPTGATLGVHGALQEPEGLRLDFDIDIDATATRVGETTTLDIAFDLRVDARDLSIAGTVSGVEEGVAGEGSVELVVRHADDSIRLTVDGADGVIDGSIFVNGALFATVTGDPHDPVITSASGDPLTLPEVLLLHRIADGAEDVFDFLEDLVDPVDALIILAIIL